uniref:NADH-ubiquinone oxidoreductase chain 6 n=1 Tax=Eudarcia gwangneungensis TaxID=2716286 RepID=A0A6G7MZF1_9NEOP|nr:NADH dehydrogenase subunit 6 [Eudarcia gwangneungensis]QIJ46448.1 NADH dehydrogenase subunit 6 [Eudarcia gwangneungensis]
MKLMLLYYLMVNSSIMIFLNHPLSMGFMILLQTMFICLLSGLMISSYWFSYILFLTFLGGLLVLFIYVSSIASNEMFSFLNQTTLSILIISLTNFILMLIFYKKMWMNLSFNLDMLNFSNKFFFLNNENSFNLMKLYNSQNFMLMIMMIFYLLITLIAIIKITNMKFGPLRSMN